MAAEQPPPYRPSALVDDGLDETEINSLRKRLFRHLRPATAEAVRREKFLVLLNRMKDAGFRRGEIERLYAAEPWLDSLTADIRQ